MNDLISLRGVTHGFELNNQAITLFENLDIDFPEGQSVSIIGPSGVGKSSLLMLMAGLETPLKGQFEFRQDGKIQNATKLRQHSGFVFQQFHLLPELDALNNLALPLRLKGHADADLIAKQWLQKVGLEGRENHRPNQLSGGEQQRVAIARAFISKPKFVFADEPTGNLDKHTADAVKQLMFDCAKTQNAGLLYVTHDQDFAMMADSPLRLSSDGLTALKPSVTKLEAAV